MTEPKRMTSIFRRVEMEVHIAADLNVFNHPRRCQRCCEGGACPAYRDRQHFIWPSNRDHHLRQLS